MSWLALVKGSTFALPNFPQIWDTTPFHDKSLTSPVSYSLCPSHWAKNASVCGIWGLATGWYATYESLFVPAVQSKTTIPHVATCLNLTSKQNNIKWWIERVANGLNKSKWDEQCGLREQLDWALQCVHVESTANRLSIRLETVSLGIAGHGCLWLLSCSS